MTPGWSLRGRLTLSMAAILCGGLAAVTGLHEMEESGHGIGERLSRLVLGDELPEPWQDMAVLAPFGMLILALVGIVTRRSLRPLLHASAEAARVGPHSPERRIGTNGLPSELAPLVGAMNLALDRMAGAYELERRFTLNAAHELRTPLTTLSLRLQRIRHDGVPIDWPAIDGDVAAMSGLIDRLLDLARKEAAAAAGSRHDGRQTMLDLCRPIRAAAAQMLPLVEAAGRSVAVELPDRLPVRGDMADLHDMVRNLIENALVHGMGGIVLRGRLGTGAAGVVAMLDVADDGPAIAPGQGEQLFERFRKGRQAGRGSGLGLGIVREVARGHGGSVGFVDGACCVVRVVLPSSAPVSADPSGQR